MSRQHSAVLIALASALISASACSGDETETGIGGGSDAAASTGGLTAYDPPASFDTTSGVALPSSVGAGKVTNGGTIDGDLPIVLDGRTVFIAEPDGLLGIDGLSGDTTADVRPEMEPANAGEDFGGFESSPLQPPVIGEVEGQRLVLVPVAVSIPGSGTTPDSRAIEILAADADTGEQAWTLDLAVPEWGQEDYYDLWPTAVGVAGTTLIISASADDDVISYGVDLTTRTVRWQKDGFGASVVGEGVAVGGTGHALLGEAQVLALNAVTGATTWSIDGGRGLISAGPKAVIVTDGSSIPGEGTYAIRTMSTGAVLKEGDADFSFIQCDYDERSVTVCARGMFGAFAGAVDASGEWLWILPDDSQGRVAPAVTTAWHGIVYGRTENGPLLLDATTGRDRSEQPGFAPHVVNEYLGVGLDDANDLVVHPADG